MESNDSVRAARAVAWLARAWERSLGEVELSLPQYRTLAFLSEGDWAASKLADRMDVSRPSVTALVDGLVTRGLVERRHSETDRRRVLHVITEEGRGALADADRRLGDEVERILGHLDGERSATTLAGLVAVHEAIHLAHREALAR